MAGRQAAGGFGWGGSIAVYRQLVHSSFLILKEHGGHSKVLGRRNSR